MRRAALIAIALAACGVKAPPRPPLKATVPASTPTPTPTPASTSASTPTPTDPHP
ncbi:MAG TPA: hypothetical protein VF841_16475 [Anaeromyxobacter sp.]